MAKAGRKQTERSPSKEAQRARLVLAGIVPKPREKSGKAQRPSRKEMERLEQLRREGEKVAVLSQPHRRGDARQECASAFGRFILRCPEEHRVAFKNAGDDYAATVMRWRAAKGVPSLRSHGEPSLGLGPSDAAVVKWGRSMVEADKAMADATTEGWLCIRQLVLDEYDIGMDQDGFAKVAVEALAVHYGMMRATRHPYAA